MPDNTPRLLTRRTFLMTTVPFAALTAAGCTPSYINTQDLGQRATGAEIKAHYSGKSVRFANEAGGPVNTEHHYGADGTFKSVHLQEDMFGLGTWRIHSSLGTDKLIVEVTGYFVDRNGVSKASTQASFVVYIQPDGSAILDQMGSGNFDQPKPRQGFPMASRWNALKRKAGV